MKALVFSGQGAHRKKMCLDLIKSKKIGDVWEGMKNVMMQNYGIQLQEIVNENPTKVNVFEQAQSLDYIRSFSCKEVKNNSESVPRTKIITHAGGVMSYTYFTQPCMLAAHMVALESLKETQKMNLEDFEFIGGHSLGEFSALCALGIFSPEVAVNLTYRRGLLMESVLDLHDRSRYRMFACNPMRAKLDENQETADDIFFVLVELIARALSQTTSFLEVSNYNLLHEQYVVAGDAVSLAILGKCLDPQFRANAISTTLDNLVREAVKAVGVDNKEGITQFPNDVKIEDFVSSSYRRYGHRSVFRRFMRGPDDGYTPAPSELPQLTLQEDGRSGLKRKTWYVPLSVEIPFHTSKLSRAADFFLPIVRDALPEEDKLREILSIDATGNVSRKKKPLWVCNLSGKVFDPLSESFQKEAEEIMNSLNVGEVRHKGRYSSSLIVDTFKSGVETKCVREMCASVLSAQMSHPALWIDVMDEMVSKGAEDIIEVSPTRNTADMFKRSNFERVGRDPKKPLLTRTYPADAKLF